MGDPGIFGNQDLSAGYIYFAQMGSQGDHIIFSHR